MQQLSTLGLIYHNDFWQPWPKSGLQRCLNMRYCRHFKNIVDTRTGLTTSGIAAVLCSYNSIWWRCNASGIILKLRPILPVIGHINICALIPDNLCTQVSRHAIYNHMKFRLPTQVTFIQRLFVCTMLNRKCYKRFNVTFIATSSRNHLLTYEILAHGLMYCVLQ